MTFFYDTPQHKDRFLIKKNIEIFYQGEKTHADLYKSKRNGTKTPTYMWFKYKNRWITPFEQRARGAYFTDYFNSFFIFCYTQNPIWMSAIADCRFMQFVQKEPKQKGSTFHRP